MNLPSRSKHRHLVRILLWLLEVRSDAGTKSGTSRGTSRIVVSIPSRRGTWKMGQLHCFFDYKNCHTAGRCLVNNRTRRRGFQCLAEQKVQRNWGSDWVFVGSKELYGMDSAVRSISACSTQLGSQVVHKHVFNSLFGILRLRHACISSFEHLMYMVEICHTVWCYKNCQPTSMPL